MKIEQKKVKIEERIADRVMKEVARIFKKDASVITRDTRFVEDLKAKSLNIVELIALLQDEFEIEIPYGEAKRRKTVGEAIDLVITIRKR